MGPAINLLAAAYHIRQDRAMPTQLQTNLLVWALMIHIAADWLFQTDWMATHKMNLRHPAGWVHSGIHVLCLLLVLPWSLALAVGVSHLLIDTRIPVQWWMRVVKGMAPGTPTFDRLEIWMDQVFHVMVLALAVVLFI
jgi:hypothetical protein